MELFINPNATPAVLQLKATGNPLASLKLKRNAVVPLSVTVLGITNAERLKLGIRSSHEGELLTYAAADTGEQTDKGTVFALRLHVSSEALNAALRVGDGIESAVPKLLAMTEITWREDGETRITDTITTTILNDIVRAAEEPPASAATEYPAPDTIATKSWVNDQTATATQKGLTQLGTDEIVPNDRAAHVGKTAAGGLAVDTVKFSPYSVAVRNGFEGTEAEWLETLKGTPGTEGKSAYALAVEKGYTGTVEEWLAALKGEPGENTGLTHEEVEAMLTTGTEDVSTPAGTQARWWSWCQIAAIHVPAHQELLAVILKAGDDVSDAYVGEFRLSVWEADEQGEFHALALSTNTCHHVAGQEMVFEFAPGVYFAGRSLRFCSGSADATTNVWDMSRIIRTRAAASSEGDFMQQSSRLYWLPEIVFRMHAPRFVSPADLNGHTNDTVKHTTAEERTAWNNAATTITEHTGSTASHVSTAQASILSAFEWDSVRGISFIHTTDGAVDNRLRVMLSATGANLVTSGSLTLQAAQIGMSTRTAFQAWTDSSTGTSYNYGGHTMNDTEMAPYGITEPCVWCGEPSLPLLLRGSEIRINGNVIDVAKLVSLLTRADQLLELAGSPIPTPGDDSNQN